MSVEFEISDLIPASPQVVYDTWLSSEGHAAMTVLNARVRSKALVEAPVCTFAVEMKVDIAQRRQKHIWILALPHFAVGKLEPDLIGNRPALGFDKRRKQAALMYASHLERSAVLKTHLGRRGVGMHGPNHHGGSRASIERTALL